MKDYYSLFAFFNNIDEAGLYSYFTSEMPTPAIPVTDEKSNETLKQLKDGIKTAEANLEVLRKAQQKAYNQWLQNPNDLNISGVIGKFDFDDLKKGLKNQVKGPDGSGPAKIIEGADGKAFAR